MKKIILSAMLVASGFAVMAQRNSFLVYGNLEVQSEKNSNAFKYQRFLVTPGVGYQWNDHWTGGVNLKAGRSKFENSALTNEHDASEFGVGPFVRYAYPLSPIFAVYGQLNTNFVSGKVAGIKTNGFEGVFFPAIGVNLKNSFALNFNFGNLSFLSRKFKENSASETDFHLDFGSGVGFGISKNFGK